MTRFPFNFLEQDVRRIRKVIEPDFLGTLHMTLGVDRVHPDFPNLPFHIVRPLKKGFNLRHAASCIKYLQFDKKLEEALIQWYDEWKAEDDNALRGKVSRADHIRKLAELFLKLKGEPLRNILAVDVESKERWKNNLRRKNLTWADVAIPASVAAKVVSPLFKKYWKVNWTLEREFQRHL